MQSRRGCCVQLSHQRKRPLDVRFAQGEEKINEFSVCASVITLTNAVHKKFSFVRKAWETNDRAFVRLRMRDIASRPLKRVNFATFSIPRMPGKPLCETNLKMVIHVE